MHKVDESSSLLNKKKVSCATNDYHQHYSSSLEWTESSWTRFLHALFWWWIKPMLYKGYKQQLTTDDLDGVPQIDKALLLLERLSSYDWSSTTTWRIVYKEFWKDYVFASILIIPRMITSISQPLLLRQILLNIMNEKGSNTASYMYAVLLFISAPALMFMHRHSMFRLGRIGGRILNTLTMIIYTHALSLKSVSLKEMNTGQVINLITNDVSQFEELCLYLANFFEGIIETIIIFILLCWIMKPIPTLCGYALFPVFILFQLYISQKFSRYHEITVIRTDKRVEAFKEFINGCHIAKMYNWEKSLGDRIVEMRDNESASIRRASLYRALNMTIFFMSASLFALTTFGSAWFLGYPLTIDNTFPALALFSVMRVHAMYYIPLAIEKLSVIKSASRRIDSFMRLTMKQDNQSRLPMSLINEQEKGNIMISNASFSWHEDTRFLSVSNLTIKKGALVGIVGPVGSGKSSFFAAILGEMNLINGLLNTNNSSFAYAAQSPWIIEDTFRNNILLNRPLDQQRYRYVIHACCLDDDISIFGPIEDRIMIGENGFNLSGGQRARVSLARALYTDADIYLLDDPLSAVDRKVAKQIYERCLGPFGLLRNKTRLLATHQTEFLNETDQIIFLSHGHVDQRNCLNESIIRENNSNENETSKLVSLLDDNISIDNFRPIVTDEKLIDDSSMFSTLYHLCSAPPFSKNGFCILIIVLLLGEALNSGSNYWLSICLKQSGTNQQISLKYAFIYFCLIIAAVILDVVRTNYYFTIIINGSNSLHKKMLRGLLHASIQFFESNPSGRILNRASKDQYVIDELLPVTLLNGVKALLLTLGSLFIICFIDKSLFHVLLIIVIGSCLITYFYQRCLRRFKTLETTTRNPVYALFSSSFDGLPTIRSLKAENSFIQLIADRIDKRTSAYFLVQAASQLFSITMSIFSSFILIVTSVRIIQSHERVEASTAALRLMNAMFVSLWFQWALRELSESDIMMISAKRIDEYSRLPSEEDRGGHKGLVKASSEWPTEGKIKFRNYSLRHRLNSEYAIRDINFCIESGQKIGIIGRTGAGKSSIFKGLFRFVHRSCVDGEILIDNIDISRIALNHLRSHISVIPQQPILFSGTLRYNLDPFNHYSDEECWKALADVQLKQFVSNHSAGLLMSIDKSGKTLSIGQCQLVCIARAILKKSKILLIDEATANVDQETDDIIQAVFRDKFQDRTILTIAHRLHTVARHDRILVLDRGTMVNFDTPANILHSYY
ncbi:unnamed protein product [Rotaria sp. Silwood1]|nr:unnamed protein product [Rotaria sp. Silwood1]